MIRNFLRRVGGLVGLGVRLATSRATYTARQRVLFSLLGVAVAIGMLVVVTGLGVGLATSTTVYDDDIDYWIVPDDDSHSSPLVATDGPMFGSVHETAAQIRAHDDVDAATPVLTEVLRLDREGTEEYVLVVGIINEPELDRVVGVDTGPLAYDDPYYASENESTEWTGEIVLSESASSLLKADTGDNVTVGGNDSFTVVGVSEGAGSAAGDVPVALVHLSELQELTGSAQNDQAEQFVVSTSSPAVESYLEDIYPQSSVLTRGQLTAGETIDSGLPMALAVTAFVVASAIGILFVVTTMGLELVAQRRHLATLSAVGISTSSQLLLTGVQTLSTTVIGGIVGGFAGIGGIHLVNTAAMYIVTTEPIAVSSWWFLAYGVGVSVLVGLLSLPFLLVLTRRLTGGVP